METIINSLLHKTTSYLSKYLQKILPSLAKDWWNQAVVNNLSFQQQQRLTQNKSNSLASLDLSALLRVFDKNWHPISSKLNLPPESRHFVKEMQTIRNRWSHAGASGFATEDIYRDLDTLQRFALVIGTDEDFLREIFLIKNSLLVKNMTNLTGNNINNQKEFLKSQKSIYEFEPGQIVFLKSNIEIRGAVISGLPGVPENRFNVFINGEIQIYYASQLQAETQKEVDALFLDCEHFHSYLTALQIRYPGLSTLYSLNAARIDFIPYQFRPVLRFIRSDRPRLLIADGVGVGKTIEAGLILREIQARRDILSVLIICPRPLVTESKWQNEMKRFEERFIHLDGRTLRNCINEMDRNGYWPEQYEKVIIPYSLFDEALLYGSEPGSKRKWKKGLLDLDPPPRFDLVIVDEAHHIRNQDTFSHKAVRFFCDHAEAVVFLTATPIQLGSQDLFVLLNVLRPDIIIDKESFEHMAEPNPYINQAISLIRLQESEWHINVAENLLKAVSTPWGNAILKNNPEFNRIYSRIKEGNITIEERIQLLNDIEALHTFSGIINRTRRRDIDNFTIRKPETVNINFTSSQQHLHDELLKIQAEIFSKIHGNSNIKFMMTTIRRQAASCLYGLIPFLEDILNKRIDELVWDEADNTEEIPQLDNIISIESRIQIIIEMAKNFDTYDPKLETLRNILRDKQKLQNNKVMIFSSFRHTLSYLFKNLKYDDFKIGMIHGGTPDEERIELRNRFEKPRDSHESVDILLFSEIGCEGLDYQFCDCIINYDLPWNPMRVEQRIGRIDRNGQKSESVTIINMITPGTVDADIYERCLLRIGVFNNALGAGEEILGEITTEIKNIAENFLLSKKEQREKLQQLADNKIRLIKEQEELEQKQLELFGIRLPKDIMKKEIEDASSFWLTPESINRMVNQYLQKVCGKEQEFILGDKPLKTLRLSQEARNVLLQDFKKLNKQNTSSFREWEKWLKGGSPHTTITFDTECATQHPEAVFIMPLHPLVKQAAYSFDTKKRINTSFRVISKDVPAGKYEFAIYQWQYHGIKEDLILQPVATSKILTKHLSSLLVKAEDISLSESDKTHSNSWENLDAQHYKLWLIANNKHKQRTKELGEFRRESLKISHKARMALLEEQLNMADNEKIKKMRQSQIANAEADYARRRQEIEIAMERTDITFKPVAYGIIYVDGCAK